jgi:hypothetical protein
MLNCIRDLIELPVWIHYPLSHSLPLPLGHLYTVSRHFFVIETHQYQGVSRPVISETMGLDYGYMNRQRLSLL